MVEYTVETLVHLYDSLNGQIAEAINNLNEFNKVGLDPHVAESYYEQLEKEFKKANDRLERLTNMRNDVEALLQNILRVERAEVE